MSEAIPIPWVQPAQKRLFDLGVACLLLLLAAPLMLWIAAAVKLSNGGSVLYGQRRIGLHGKSFWLWKFRTMRPGSDDGLHRAYIRAWIDHNAPYRQGVFKVTADPRVSPIGRLLRRFCLDELPQLWNVLKGDMSLIGPRPPLPYEVLRYRRHHFRRLEAVPGITGLWQVSGRHCLSFEEMVTLDVDYLENWSLWLDFKILWRTVGVVLFEPGY